MSRLNEQQLKEKFLDVLDAIRKTGVAVEVDKFSRIDDGHPQLPIEMEAYLVVTNQSDVTDKAGMLEQIWHNVGDVDELTMGFAQLGDEKHTVRVYFFEP